MADRMTPEQVATLDAYEWVSRARRGEFVPTVEQWEAAERLAALTRNDAHPDSIVAKLADIISPPKPPPLPEIEACPRCGEKCRATETDLGNRVCKCTLCNWVGPAANTDREPIEGHNDEARKLRPEPQPEPVKRRSTCRHEHARASLEPCRSCVCDAAAWSNWEPKP